jgi:phage/plasmid-associated DNA primase
MGMLGRKNYLSTSIQQLGDEFGLAEAPGKLALIVDDAQYGSAKNFELFLQRRRNISGGVPIVIRRMRENPFDVLLSARLVYSSDDLPRMKDSGGQDEVRRSVLRFLFNPERSKKKLNMDEHREMIDKMLSSIFWHYTLQLGERALREDKCFMNPANTGDLLEDVTWDTQPYKKFLEHEFTQGDKSDPSCVALVSDCFERWQMFCNAYDIVSKSTKNKRWFSKAFSKDTGVEKKRISQTWYFLGVKLRPASKVSTPEQEKMNPQTGEF